jgi:hypothetical protein
VAIAGGIDIGKSLLVARRPLESVDFASLCSEHSWEVESLGCLAWFAGVCRGFARVLPWFAKLI